MTRHFPMLIAALLPAPLAAAPITSAEKPGAAAPFDILAAEVGRRALEALIADGRIQPGRIEDIVTKVRAELDTQLVELGVGITVSAVMIAIFFSFAGRGPSKGGPERP